MRAAPARNCAFHGTRWIAPRGARGTRATKNQRCVAPVRQTAWRSWTTTVRGATGRRGYPFHIGDRNPMSVPQHQRAIASVSRGRAIRTTARMQRQQRQKPQPTQVLHVIPNVEGKRKMTLCRQPDGSVGARRWDPTGARSQHVHQHAMLTTKADMNPVGRGRMVQNV